MIANANSVPMPDDEDDDDTELEPTPDAPVTDGGRGEVVDEYPISGVQDANLIARAAINRWPTTDKAKKLAVNRTIRHIKSDDPRRSLGGIRALIAMEGQNQADQKPAHGGVTINGNVAIQVNESDDWYGNNAHALAAKSLAAPNPGAAIPGPVQDAGVRKALGKNGTRPASDN